jgi:hypothetical protein
MKIATRALTTMLIIAMLTISTATATAMTGESKPLHNGDKKLERIYRHHDRKFELRASVLGMTSTELREELRTKPFDTIIKKHGFKNRQSFYTAVSGKVKDELKRRGWSDQKIDKFMQKKLDRLGKFLPQRTQG